MLKLAAQFDYWNAKANECYRQYDVEWQARPRDGQDWRRGPLPSWRAYQAACAEIDDCAGALQRLSGQRWDCRKGGVWDKCWR